MKKLNLFQYRWDLSLLAELYQSSGAKFVTLQSRFDISRGILKTSLERLILAGLVVQNPGYGHPMRPEYILTPFGTSVGSLCNDLLDEGEKRGVSDIFYDKWSCPIVFSTGKEKVRFNTLKKSLNPITSRALSGSLKKLHQLECIKRSLLDANPPMNIYSIGKKSMGLFRIYDERKSEFDKKILI